MALDESAIYRRIGEFVVLYQWIENRLREIGWFILDPDRRSWPPTALRSISSAELFTRVEALFLDALPKCRLGDELESEYRTSFARCAEAFTELRKARNKILHSAFVELKAGGDIAAIMRVDPRGDIDPETGDRLFDSQTLSSESFSAEFEIMAKLAMFLNRCYIQLLHRLPHPD